MEKINIFWFRRDLRLHDNAGLYHSLKSVLPVLPLFIFDTNILGELEEKKDKRVEFIRDVLVDMKAQLKEIKSDLRVFYNTPLKAFEHILTSYEVSTVFANHDYEPYAIERDEVIKNLLQKNGVQFKTYKDQVIFEKNEVLKDDGKPYTVYTPYSKKWKNTLRDFYIKPYPCKQYFKNFLKYAATEIPSLSSMDFYEKKQEIPSKTPPDAILKNYNKTRDFPAIEDGTSRLGIHLRFGTLSIRKEVGKAKKLSDTFLNELIWREFYMSILWHFPHVGHHKAFKPAYDNIDWRNNEDEFQKWCKGKTGFPIIDAGMRQLNETG
ncbi:MAG: deoxyribodipyrimidine photo-lyase, partial [Ginsengibacter sp.]